MSGLCKAAKWATFTVCGYEAVSGFSGRAPTVSALCGRYRRTLPPIILAGLAVHLYYRKESI